MELGEDAGRRQLCVIAQGRAQREGAWRTGEIPQPHEAPFLAPRIGDGQLIERDMKRRSLPAVGGLDLDQLIVTVRLNAPEFDAKTTATLHRLTAAFDLYICARANRHGSVTVV